MNGRPITLVSLTPKQIYEEQLKLKKENMVKKESLHIKGTFFANKVHLGFDDDVILQLGIDLLTLEDVFHHINLRSNLLKEEEDDTNQVKSELDLKIYANQFCEINNIYQTIHWNELTLYMEILKTWNYILVNFQVKYNLEIYYFKRSKLLNKSCQICQTKPLCIVWDISRSIGGNVLRFKLIQKPDILSFPTIYGRSNNSSIRERMTCLKS